MSHGRCFLVTVSLALASLVAWGAGSPSGASDTPPLRVPPGFSIERVAGPDLVSYPMFATQDGEGRLYVSESTEPNVMTTEEMAASPSYRVRVLEDRDGDGVFDRSHVFADKIAFPQGGVFTRGALYVSAAPDLLRLEDTDGDGIADRRDVLLTGWTLSVNGALLHGPFQGPDGWLYLTDARRSYSIETREGELLEGKGGRIWRCRLDGTGLEVVSAGGFDNPVELVFTPAGETLGTMTFFMDPQAGLRDALMHWVEGGVYPKPHRVIEEDRLQRTGDLMPVMTKFANVAPSGLLRYRGEALGSEYSGNLFSAQFNTHRVLRHVLSRDGATFSTLDEEFLTSDDPNFHPTDVLQDADGSLLVLDTGGWFLEGCPLSRVARPEYRGGIYRIRRIGASTPEDPRGRAASLGTLSPEELAGFLGDPRPAVYDRVVEMLVEHGESAVTSLKSLRETHDSSEARAAAVFCLFRIGSPEALRGVRQALGDADPGVRVAAARAAGMARDPAAVSRLGGLLLDDDLAVRRQAGTALAQIGDHSVVGAVLSALAAPADRFVEHALTYALLRLPEPSRMAAGLGDPSPRVRKAALIALDQMEGRPLEERQLLPLLDSEDADLRRTALWVASRHLEWSPGISAFLEDRLRADLSDGELAALADALHGLCVAPEVQASIARLLQSDATPSERRRPLLETLASCPVKKFPEAWIGPLRRQLDSSSPDVRATAVDVVRTRELPQLANELDAIARAGDVDLHLRVAALDALIRMGPELSSERFDLLFDQLDSPDAPLRQLTASALGRARLTDPQLLRVATDSLSEADLLLVPSLLEAFRRGTNEEVGMALVASLTELAPVLDGLAAEGLTDLLSTYPDSVGTAALPLLARLDELKGNRLERLEGLLARLEPGEASRGRDLFFGPTVGCSSCHSVGSEGGRVGPDLTAIGAIRSRHDLLEAIMFPSASFVRQFESYRVETELDVYAGIIDERTPEAIVLVTGADYRVRVPRGDVVSMDPSPVSMMPEGLHEAVSLAELSDLMTFLEALGQSSELPRPLRP